MLKQSAACILGLRAKLAIYEPSERDETLVCSVCGTPYRTSPDLYPECYCSQDVGSYAVQKWKRDAAQKIMETK